MDNITILALVMIGLIACLTIAALTKFYRIENQIEDLHLQVNRSKDWVTNLYELLHKLKSNNLIITKQKVDKPINNSGKEPVNIHIPDLHYFGKCPICHSIVTDRNSYCDKCGQKIDWKDKSRSDIEAILAATNLSKANVIDSNLRGADK